MYFNVILLVLTLCMLLVHHYYQTITRETIKGQKSVERLSCGEIMMGIYFSNRSQRVSS